MTPLKPGCLAKRSVFVRYLASLTANRGVSRCKLPVAGLVLLFGLTVLTGCGGDSSSSGSRSTPPVADTEEAVWGQSNWGEAEWQ